MNIEAAWGMLRVNRADVEHTETHEGAPGEGWVTEKHPGYVVRPCHCGSYFIVSPQSNAVDCGSAHKRA